MPYKYKQPLSDELYRKLNKDKSVNHFFQTKYVGKCMKLISDFHKYHESKTHKDWEHSYKCSVGYKQLSYVSQRIHLKNQWIPLDQVKQYVFYRVIGQTWNGYQQELSIIEELKEQFTNIDIIKTDFEKDHTYCIDAEIIKDDYIILGIQIKPISYKMMNTAYQNRAKENHKEKNDNYARMFAPYVYVYYDDNGIVDKQETINKINTIMHLNI